MEDFNRMPRSERAMSDISEQGIFVALWNPYYFILQTSYWHMKDINTFKN
jgi:hypothetical protein